MGKKKLVKKIREISVRIPTVKEEHASGYIPLEDENGVQAFQPNKYIVDVNHERRLRRAYQRYGMEGIKGYLESITKIQKQRSDELTHKTTKD